MATRDDLPPTHREQAEKLLGRLYETNRYVNNRPVFPLDNAGPQAVATAAVAHALLALVDQVFDLTNSVDTMAARNS